MFFENIWAVINLFSYILIAFEVCSTTLFFLKGRMVPWTGGDLTDSATCRGELDFPEFFPS
jgi:hypothetical protein